MNVLVTGATGFIGAAAVRALLQHGHRVVGLVRDTAKGRELTEIGAELAVGDMWQPETYAPLVGRVEAVVHAAQLKPNGGWNRRSIRAMHESDALMTRTLAAACLEQNKLFAYTSGALTHARSDDEWIDETAPATPCRLARGHAEMIEELTAMHHAKGLRFVVLSPGFVYGPGGLMAVMVERLRAGRYPVIGNGRNFWSLVYVEDVGEAYALAVERGTPGQTYFLGDDQPLRRREVIERTADALGAARPGGMSAWLAGLMLGFPMIEAITASIRLRNAKAKQQLGWAPRFASFADGLPVTLKQLIGEEKE